jgi:predicted ATPase
VEVTIANIGPIRSASVKIAPLTVLVGPNNSGKSMVLTVLHATLAQFGAGIMPFEMTRPIRRLAPDLDDENAEISANAVSLISGPRKPELSDLHPKVQETVVKRIEAAFGVYADLFIDQLALSAGTPIENLRRAGKGTSPSSITIISASPSWRVSIRVNASNVRREIQPPTLEEAWDSVDWDAWRRFRSRIRRTGRPSASSVFSDLSVEVIRACFSDFPRHTRYMPAARSGLMQSHKALAGSLVRRASYAGIRDMQIPAVSGIIADFLGEMIEIDSRTRNGSFERQALRLEDEILHGTIAFQEDLTGGGGYPEPVYRSQDGEFPLGRTSSMVSELAPVVLYLRHVMQQGDLLMIEEPEAHLHPQAQVAFAKALIRLVNDGLKIALTTHSEFFLQQINNAVVAARLNGNPLGKVGLDPDTRIAAKDTSAYLFRPEAAGTQVVELEVDPREGIPEDSFSEVAEYLYAQTVALDKRVSGESAA